MQMHVNTKVMQLPATENEQCIFHSQNEKLLLYFHIELLLKEMRSDYFLNKTV